MDNIYTKETVQDTAGAVKGRVGIRLKKDYLKQDEILALIGALELMGAEYYQKTYGFCTQMMFFG